MVVTICRIKISGYHLIGFTDTYHEIFTRRVVKLGYARSGYSGEATPHESRNGGYLRIRQTHKVLCIMLPAGVL